MGYIGVCSEDRALNDVRFSYQNHIDKSQDNVNGNGYGKTSFLGTLLFRFLR